MMKHVEWETLNDYADDAALLDASTRQGVAQHLAECRECREVLLRLRNLLEIAGEMSKVEPPAESWTAINESISRRKSVSLVDRMPAATPARRALRTWASAGAIAVAAGSLVLLYENRASVEGRQSGAGPVSASLPVEVRRIEREYTVAAEALAEAMKEPRVHLGTPEVVESLERSVAVIDTAIAEARDALMKDPDSELVRDALVRNYQQKIDLLRRVTARASSN